MQAMINMVATRQKAGTPTELLRWYNDHVHLLLRFDGLDGATLYRRSHALDPLNASPAPDYVCLYRFASMATFADFEASQAKELARQVTQSGWGATGIEIIQRSQYLAGGNWSGPANASGASRRHIQCLDIAGAKRDSPRWIADRLYVATSSGDVRHCEWYTQADASSTQQQAIVLASLSDDAINPARPWLRWWESTTSHGQTEPMGQAPDAITARWAADYGHVCAWQR